MQEEKEAIASASPDPCFFYGNGENYYLTQEEWERLQASPDTATDPYFDQGIGRLNYGSDGRIDTYDFEPVWDSGRETSSNILNTGGAFIGYIFQGKPFGIFPPK